MAWTQECCNQKNTERQPKIVSRQLKFLPYISYTSERRLDPRKTSLQSFCSSTSSGTVALLAVHKAFLTHHHLWIKNYSFIMSPVRNRAFTEHCMPGIWGLSMSLPRTQKTYKIHVFGKLTISMGKTGKNNTSQ